MQQVRRRMHENSVNTYRTLDTHTRRDYILTAYQDGEALTDRQVKNKLHMSDMNEVRPRITELVTGKPGIPKRLRQIGKRKEGGRMVRVCALIVREPEQVELF